MNINQTNTIKNLDTEEMYLNMGPQHPSTHGVMRLGLKIEGEVILSATPDIGYLHRGMEKLAEARTYVQNVCLSDRWDYLSSALNEFAYCTTVEKLLKAQVPERADYLRVITAELNRIASHLVLFGIYAIDIGAVTPLLYAFREREIITDLMESLSGGRLLLNYFRIGGVSRDIPENFVAKTNEFLDWFEKRLPEYDDLLTNNVIFLDRTKNIGVLSAEDAINYGISGPSLRASGVKFDIRKNEAYSVYNKFDFEIPTGKNGDSWDRYYMRMLEMKESARIIRQAVNSIPEGEIITKLPKVIKPEPGEVYNRIESSRGELGIYLVSDGSQKPYRLKIRGPSFVNLMLLPQLLKGWKIADVVAILGSIDIVLGEADR
ncbi:MAG: NADH-quinone oxidoreductase subunit D [Candidatus Omnitrophota bacterium]